MKFRFFIPFLFLISTSIAFGQWSSNNASALDSRLLNRAAEVLDKQSVLPGSKGSALLINQFSSGPSLTELEFLNSESFSPIETQRLKNARIAWLNYDLLRDLGFQVPPEGLTPELENALLDAFAYVVPNERISSDKFLPTKKTFYADRYGGSGTGYAEGSGRAAAAGMFQIKGIGRTRLAEELKKEKIPLITWNPKSWSPLEI